MIIKNLKNTDIPTFSWNQIHETNLIIGIAFFATLCYKFVIRLIINVFLVNDNGRYTNEIWEKQRNNANCTCYNYNSLINIGTG